MESVEPSFVHHPGFDAEGARFRKKHRTFDADLRRLKALLGAHFGRPPRHCIGPNSLYAVQKWADDGWELWKVHCVVVGLSSGQRPRIYFAKFSDSIALLCMDSHIEDYDDAELRARALKRLEELLRADSELTPSKEPSR